MGSTRRPGKVTLIVGLIASDVDIFPKVEKLLTRRFGRIDFESSILDFTHTDYYTPEMGGNLKRKFLAFDRLRDLDTIYAAKLLTNRIESCFLRSGKRTVNIDPGYLDLSKVVLFSTKDYTHRIHLKKGIFAEVTLFYKNDTFNIWPWTYPDYKTKAYIDIFNSIRTAYKTKICRKAI
jgi:hypothetical protein